MKSSVSIEQEKGRVMNKKQAEEIIREYIPQIIHRSLATVEDRLFDSYGEEGSKYHLSGQSEE